MDLIYSKEKAASVFTPIRRVYLLYGEDEILKEEALNELLARAIDPSFAAFDFESLEAFTAPPDQILASAGQAPFGSNVRLVVIRGAEIYRKRERQQDSEQLAAGFDDLGSASCLVLRVGAEPDEKSRGKTILTSRLDAAVREHGCILQFRALSEERMADWLIARAAQAGKRLDEPAALRLVAVGRGDRLQLQNELEKAICYVGEADRISLQAVEATCSFDPEDVMFKLVDAITQRNADRALCLLRELLRYDTKPQSVAGRLLALLARQYRLLWQARELQQRRMSSDMLKNLPPEIASELPGDTSITSMAWKGRELFGMARSWDRSALLRAFDLLVECDLANKGGAEGSEDIVANVEIVILRLCGDTRASGASA